MLFSYPKQGFPGLSQLYWRYQRSLSGQHRTETEGKGCLSILTERNEFLFFLTVMTEKKIILRNEIFLSLNDKKFLYWGGSTQTEIYGKKKYVKKCALFTLYGVGIKIIIIFFKFFNVKNLLIFLSQTLFKCDQRECVARYGSWPENTLF